MRAQLEKKLAQKEKEKKEEHLRQLAQKAREDRAGVRPAGNAGKFHCIIRFILKISFAQELPLPFVGTYFVVIFLFPPMRKFFDSSQKTNQSQCL